MNRIIIGFHGRTGSGCTAAARELAMRLDARRRSLHEPIVAIADDFGISPIEMTSWRDHPVPWLGGMTPRTFLRLFGRGFRRAMGPGFLASHAVDMIQRGEDLYTVIDDVQRVAEVAELAPFDVRAGANPADIYTVLVHVNRPGVPGDPGDDGDREVDLVDPGRFAAVLDNDGDLTDLRLRVNQMFDRLRFAHPLLRRPGAGAGTEAP